MKRQLTQELSEFQIKNVKENDCESHRKWNPKCEWRKWDHQHIRNTKDYFIWLYNCNFCFLLNWNVQNPVIKKPESKQLVKSSFSEFLRQLLLLYALDSRGARVLTRPVLSRFAPSSMVLKPHVNLSKMMYNAGLHAWNVIIIRSLIFLQTPVFSCAFWVCPTDKNEFILGNLVDRSHHFNNSKVNKRGTNLWTSFKSA